MSVPPEQAVSGVVSSRMTVKFNTFLMSLSADPDADSDMRNVLNLTVILDDTTPDTACSGGTDMTSTIDAQVGNGGSPLTLAEFDDGTDVFDAFLTGTGLTAGAV